MEFRNLKAQYHHLKAQIDSSIEEVIEESAFISGKAVHDLEQQLADYVGVRHCITCGNGTDALSLVLRAWGIGPGDAVFVPDFTFFASAETPRDRGATPIFVDVLDGTFNMDPASLERCIQAVTSEGKLIPRAIISVDLFGAPADYACIEPIARKYGLKILEDGAQGFGGMQNGQKCCSFGDAATTSFFPAKPLGCYGDGGAIFTDDSQLAALVRSLAVHGKGTDKYDNVRIGVNSRLDTLQAAILKAKLDAFIRFELDAVNQAAAYYTLRLGGIVETPVIPEVMLSSWAQYTIRLADEEERNRVMNALHAQGIPTMIYYRTCMSQQHAFEDVAEAQPIICECARALSQRVLSLPISPYITTEEMDSVIAAICRELGR